MFDTDLIPTVILHSADVDKIFSSVFTSFTTVLTEGGIDGKHSQLYLEQLLTLKFC